VGAVRVGKRLIGDGHPVFVIAELGYNFNTPEEALQSVDAAANAGVNAIKIQTFRAETITTQDTAFPAEAGGVNQFHEFKRYEISEDLHRLIFDRARGRGLIPFSTPSYFDDVELLERVGVELYKIGSDDLTNLPFLRYVAEKKKPVIFSSGMATLAEVDEAVRTMQETGNGDLILLQCVSNYPIQDLSAVNLRVIDTYRRTFGIPVGLSDHTMTLSAAVAAVALGACVIERHFALSKELPVPDAFFSADPPEMRTLVTAIRETERMLGDGVKRPATCELRMRRDTRKGLVARTLIRKGEPIRPEHLIVKRPAWGITPADWDRVLGRCPVRDIRPDEVITWGLL
jgi:sialic acid synthase SpsE